MIVESIGRKEAERRKREEPEYFRNKAVISLFEKSSRYPIPDFYNVAECFYNAVDVFYFDYRDIEVGSKLFFEGADGMADFIFAVRRKGLDIVCQSEDDESVASACVAAILEFFEGNGMSVFMNEKYSPDLNVYRKTYDALWGHSDLRKKVMEMSLEELYDFMKSSEWDRLNRELQKR